VSWAARKINERILEKLEYRPQRTLLTSVKTEKLTLDRIV